MRLFLHQIVPKMSKNAKKKFLRRIFFGPIFNYFARLVYNLPQQDDLGNIFSFIEGEQIPNL